MNSIKHSEWKSPLYLDALGSLAVIAASATIFLAGATGAMDLLPLPAGDLVEVCPVSRIALLQAEGLSFQRRDNSRQLSAVDCV